MTDCVLLAYELDGKGSGTKLATDQLAENLQTKSLSWVHLDASHADTKQWLSEMTPDLDSSVINALLADETRPRMTQVGDGILLILRGVNLNENASPEDMVSIRLWIDQSRIISLRRRKLKAVLDLEQAIENRTGPRDAGHFIIQLLTRLFSRMEPALTALDEATDAIEEAILEQANTILREQIINVRKQAIAYRRYMAPQRDAIAQLCLAPVSWLNNKHRRYLQENHDQITRYVEDLDTLRERAQIVKDELANLLSDRINKNMYILSVISAIFLPLGFLTGLLGINVGGIPGAENIHAFMIFCGLLICLVVTQIIIFRKLKWF